MARLRCETCETVLAVRVPEAQARHVARSTCRQCAPAQDEAVEAAS